MNHKAKDLTRVSLGIAAMFGIYWIYTYFLKQYLPIPEAFQTVSGLVALYVIGLGVFTFVIHKIPSQKFEKKKISLQTVLLCFLLQFTALLVTMLVMMISTAFGFNSASTDINATSRSMLFRLLLFNPVMEEFVFRKLFADKLLQYGERFYIFVSAFCFAIVHGVALGIPQVAYTFILGMIWSYLVVKTGDIKLSVMLHALSNLFGSVMTQALSGVSVALTGMYSMLLMILGIVGLILFLINKKKIVLDSDTGLSRRAVIIDIFTNKGIWFYTALTVIVMLLK